jgi:hypothetical protein
MKPFEERLADLPLQPPPADWRKSILAAAEAESRRKVVPIPAFVRNHPVAWSALAACWLMIGFLNFSGPKGDELHSLAWDSARTPSAAQTAEYFARREHFLRGVEEPVFHIDRTKL